MSTRYEDSVVRTQQQYVVQTVSKYPQEKAFLIGKRVLVVEINGSTASVKHGAGARHYIPVRSLFNVPGYTARGVRAANAHGFVVKCSNEFNIAIGTAFLEPTSVSDTHAKFTIDNKELSLPLNILISLERNKVKVKDRTVKKEATSSGVPISVIEAVAGAIKVPAITELPSAVNKLLPELNIQVLIDNIKSADIEVFDFTGEVHNSIAAAMLANEKYTHSLIQKYVMSEVTKVLSSQFTIIRNDADENI